MPVGQEETPTITVSPSAGADDAEASLVSTTPAPWAEPVALAASLVSPAARPRCPRLRPVVEQLGLDLPGDDAGDLLGVGGLAQGVGELGLHESAGELGQELEVEVVGAVGAAIMKMRSAACPSAARSRPAATGGRSRGWGART